MHVPGQATPDARPSRRPRLEMPLTPVCCRPNAAPGPSSRDRPTFTRWPPPGFGWGPPLLEDTGSQSRATRVCLGGSVQGTNKGFWCVY